MSDAKWSCTGPTSFACIAGTSLATGAIANLAPPGHPFHLAIVGVGFLLVSVVFWVAKFVIYQRVIFPVSPSTGNIEVAAPEAGTAAIGASSVNGAIASRSAVATDRSIPAAALATKSVGGLSSIRARHGRRARRG